MNGPVGDRHQDRMDWIYYFTLKKTPQSLNSDSAPKEGFLIHFLLFSSNKRQLNISSSTKKPLESVCQFWMSLCGYKSVFVLINAAVCVGF